MTVLRSPRHRVGVLLLLGALSAFAPLSFDLYLPALPQLATSLHTSDSLAQWTMSVCMIGLAVGQLVAGPLSDHVGRRRPLIVGVAVYAATALLCAAAPDVAVLIVLRLVQGLAGAAGIVVARAVVRDIYEGHQLARIFSLLGLVTGAAPVIAPLLGGQLLRLTDWRGLFVVLFLIGLLVLLACATVLPETLPASDRVGGQSELPHAMTSLWRDRAFVGCTVAILLVGCSFFTYISLSSFVLQVHYGLSAQVFSYVFGVNSAGIMLGGYLNARLVRRIGAPRMLLAALGLAAAAGVACAAAVELRLGLGGLLPPLFVVVACMGLVQPNLTALGLLHHAPRAGTASAVLGTAQFLGGSLTPPLVTAVVGATGASMTLTIAVGTLAALAVTVAIAMPAVRASALTNRNSEAKVVTYQPSSEEPG